MPIALKTTETHSGCCHRLPFRTLKLRTGRCLQPLLQPFNRRFSSTHHHHHQKQQSSSTKRHDFFRLLLFSSQNSPKAKRRSQCLVDIDIFVFPIRLAAKVRYCVWYESHCTHTYTQSPRGNTANIRTDVYIPKIQDIRQCSLPQLQPMPMTEKRNENCVRKCVWLCASECVLLNDVDGGSDDFQPISLVRSTFWLVLVTRYS